MVHVNANSFPPVPGIIGHRGAFGYRPEHSLGSYETAVGLGVDYLEWDVQPTKDNVLVLAHSAELSRWTNIQDHPEFADRYRNHTLFREGGENWNWYIEDFTLAEMKTLRLKQRLPETRGGGFDSLYGLVTLDEGLQYVQAVNDVRSRAGKGRLGLYVESKAGPYYDSIGLSVEEPLVEALHDAGYLSSGSPLYLQSFYAETLDRLKLLTPPDVKTTWLITSQDVLDSVNLNDVALVQGYTAIGPRFGLVLSNDDRGQSKGLVARAHAAGLEVHPYTIDPEMKYTKGYIDSEDAIVALLDEGVDAMFVDVPDIATRARDRWYCTKHPYAPNCYLSGIIINPSELEPCVITTTEAIGFEWTTRNKVLAVSLCFVIASASGLLTTAYLRSYARPENDDGRAQTQALRQRLAAGTRRQGTDGGWSQIAGGTAATEMDRID